MNPTQKKVLDFFTEMTVDESVDMDKFVEACSLNLGLYTSLKFEKGSQRKVISKAEKTLHHGLEIGNNLSTLRNIQVLIIRK
ncbi:hypothetical protein [Paenibacillus sp. S25]|uniref:hypothetical protein n=1 Tax=Paenibacillus sp. S25 TaxID=2823905 RepID=UPI001C6540CF|nr:hypothetical protein [Paenibacillus sp. S25]QYK62472.1 hypothetical protein KAI37_02802 [Paenibacillus sp. S25]